MGECASLLIVSWRLLTGSGRFQYHIGCLGLDKTPAGNWICPRCVERRKKQPRGKKGTRGKARK